jgi:hypothetical protein
LRWNEISGCDTLRTMYKRLLAFGIIGLLFVLALNYLLLYPLKETVKLREAQDKVTGALSTPSSISVCSLTVIPRKKPKPPSPRPARKA